MSSKNIRGYVGGILSGVCFGIVPLLVLSLYRQGMDIVSILFYKSVFSLPIIYVSAYRRQRHISIGVRRILPVCGLGVLMAACSFLAYKGYLTVDIGVSQAILFSYSVFVVLMMVGFMQRILSVKSLICILLSIAGIWITMKFTMGGAALRGVITLVVSAILYALFIVLAGLKPVRGIATLVLWFWIMLSSAFIFGCIIVARGFAVLPYSVEAIIELLLLAALPTVLAFRFATDSVNRIGYDRGAALSVSEPLTACVCGYIFLCQDISAVEAIGLVIIMASVTVLISSNGMGQNILMIRRLFPSLRRHDTHR